MRAPRFNATALFQALDEARRQRGISWQQLAREAGVAASTIKRTRDRGAMEADGVLAMLSLVGRAPEEFVVGSSGGRTAVPPKRGRFNTIALYEALESERRRRLLTWAELARELGANGASGLQRLQRGGRITADLMVASTWWLGCDVNDFIDPAFEHPGELQRKGRARS